jgi:hypothetical protein
MISSTMLATPLQVSMKNYENIVIFQAQHPADLP